MEHTRTIMISPTKGTIKESCKKCHVSSSQKRLQDHREKEKPTNYISHNFFLIFS